MRHSWMGVIALAMTSTPAVAMDWESQLDQSWAGGGLNYNDLGGNVWEDAWGFQAMAGASLIQDLGDIPSLDLGVEAGYMDSGDFELEGTGYSTSASGLWVNGLLSLTVHPKLDLIGRAGLDFGDDDGLMIGVGAGYRLLDEFEVRGELVSRNEVESLQANVVYHF